MSRIRLLCLAAVAVALAAVSFRAGGGGDETGEMPDRHDAQLAGEVPTQDGSS